MSEQRPEVQAVMITVVYSPDDGGYYGELYADRGRDGRGEERQTEVCRSRSEAMRAAIDIALRDYPGVHIEEC